MAGVPGLIAAELDAGYTSFAIDASFNEIPDNIRITAELAKPIVDADLGLEGEVGEIKSAKASSDEDALTDALRLSRGMTYKNAVAELPFGGLLAQHRAVGEHKAHDASRRETADDVLHPGEVGVPYRRHAVISSVSPPEAARHPSPSC